MGRGPWHPGPRRFQAGASWSAPTDVIPSDRHGPGARVGRATLAGPAPNALSFVCLRLTSLLAFLASGKARKGDQRSLNFISEQMCSGLAHTRPLQRGLDLQGQGSHLQAWRGGSQQRGYTETSLL